MGRVLPALWGRDDALCSKPGEIADLRASVGSRMQVLSVCGRWDQHSHPQGIWSGTELGVSVPQSARLQGDDLIRQHLERTGPPPRLLLCYSPA